MSCYAGSEQGPLIYLLVDEGHLLYDTHKLRSAALFSNLKILSSDRRVFSDGSFPLLRVAFVATYGAAPSGIDTDVAMVCVFFILVLHCPPPRICN